MPRAGIVLGDGEAKKALLHCFFPDGVDAMLCASIVLGDGDAKEALIHSVLLSPDGMDAMQCASIVLGEQRGQGGSPSGSHKLISSLVLPS